MKKHIFLFAWLLSLCACTNKSYGPFVYESPEKNRKVEVSGTQTVVLDPIKVKVTVTVPKGDKTFFLELNTPVLDTANITMEWITNDRAKMSLKQPDDTYKVLNFNLQDDRIHMVQDLPQGAE